MKANNIEVEILKSDITKEKVDCIVNAANSQLQHGGGVALAIAREGGPLIQTESDEYVEKHGKVRTGEVAVTKGGNLPAKYVIHAVGPIWRGGQNNERNLLFSAVTNSLKEAERLGCKSIALPAISSGIYGYPIKECAEIFKKAILSFSKEDTRSLKIIKICDVRDLVVKTFKKEFERSL